MDKIGSIPHNLPDLNLLESYLIKITIPFIRVAHMPRSPNLKLIGGSVCIEADINHSIGRLQINPENIIPVSFKRKLSFTGHYLEQVINKEKVFKWLEYLKQNNPFYENILLDKLHRDIDIMSSKLLQEVVEYDEFRIMKNSLDDRKKIEEKIITEDLETLSSDSEDENDIPENCLTESITEKEPPVHDTVLYNISEIVTDSNGVTNKIAEYINEKEKKTAQKEPDDSDDASYDNFLFKADDTEDFIENLEETDFFDDFISQNSPEKKKSKTEENRPEFNNKLKRKQRKPKESLKEKATVVAPGENQKFDSIKYQEEKCFPTLFPKGTGGYISTYLDTGLGLANYIKLRVTGGLSLEDSDVHEKIKKIEADSCIDAERFRRDHHYLMFLLLIGRL